VAGDQGALELRQDGATEAVHPRPRVASGGDHGQQVVPELLTEMLLHVAGRAQLADGANRGGFTHFFTLTAAARGR